MALAEFFGIHLFDLERLELLFKSFDAEGSGTVPGLLHFFYLGQCCELLETLLLMIQRQELAVTPAHVGTRVARFLLFWLQVRPATTATPACSSC